MDPRAVSQPAKLTALTARARWAGLLGSVLALGCVVASVSVVGGAEPAGSPATPVLSARRVPALVQSMAAGPALRSDLEEIVTASPPDTCLEVQLEGRILYRTGADLSLTPASNQKLVTARLALEVLGGDHRFRTEVAGDLGDSGTVNGDLYLVGGGDPVLRTRAYDAYFAEDAGRSTSLEELADAVVEAGVQHVTGSVIGDESRYDSLRAVPGWPDRYLEQHQLGPLSALEVNQGFTWFPEEYSEEGLAQLEATDNPPVFAARTFTDLLTERGVQVGGAPGSGHRAPDADTLASITSPPLDEVIAQLLDRSDNQISELLVKEVGVADGSGGTTAAGLAALADAAAALDLPADGVVTHDGSGLGYDDRLTCTVLTTVLDDVGPDSEIAHGLPIGGETGTLRERFTDDAVRGAIRAKTGSLNDVTSLAGFADPTDAPPLVFAYVANGRPVTDELLGVQERLGRALVSYGADVPLSTLGPQ